MSIILKGINKSKYARTFRIYPSGVVMEIREDGKIDNDSPYQAIQIPKEHGRLIDADALETVFKDMAKCEWNQKAFPISWAYAFEDTIDEIDNAPTILEAEEE